MRLIFASDRRSIIFWRWSMVRSCECAMWLGVVSTACNGVADGGNGDNDNDNGAAGYNNTTDRTNKDANFLGSAACRACHPTLADQHTIHGHAHKLTRVEGQAPTFPSAGTPA